MPLTSPPPPLFQTGTLTTGRLSCVAIDRIGAFAAPSGATANGGSLGSSNGSSTGSGSGALGELSSCQRDALSVALALSQRVRHPVARAIVSTAAGSAEASPGSSGGGFVPLPDFAVEAFKCVFL